jgi:hypothetical protein
MRATAAALRAAGGKLSGSGPAIGNAVERTRSQGPFFTELDGELDRIARRLQTGGTGFQTLARRLEEDAEREQALRRAEQDPDVPWYMRG